MSAPKVPHNITTPLRYSDGGPARFTTDDDDRLRVVLIGGGGGSGNLADPNVFVATTSTPAGTSVNLETPVVTGLLYSITVGSTVACKWEIVLGGITKAIFYTNPFEAFQWTSPHPDFLRAVGQVFRVVAHNLDQFSAADVSASFYVDGS